jgi:hypothetical protein
MVVQPGPANKRSALANMVKYFKENRRVVSAAPQGQQAEDLVARMAQLDGGGGGCGGNAQRGGGVRGGRGGNAQQGGREY